MESLSRKMAIFMKESGKVMNILALEYKRHKNINTQANLKMVKRTEIWKLSFKVKKYLLDHLEMIQEMESLL